jgi:hypothetical protein
MLARHIYGIHGWGGERQSKPELGYDRIILPGERLGSVLVLA